MVLIIRIKVKETHDVFKGLTIFNRRYDFRVDKSFAVYDMVVKRSSSIDIPTLCSAVWIVFFHYDTEQYLSKSCIVRSLSFIEINLLGCK